MARHHKNPKSANPPFKNKQYLDLRYNNLHSNTWGSGLTYLCPCPLILDDGIRIGSSSLSSESWLPRVGWLWPCSPSGPPSAVGSALLQPPDVSSIPSGWLFSSGEDIMLPPPEEPSAGAGADELPRAFEQEASHGGSVEAADKLCCLEGSEEAEEEHILIVQYF